MGQGQAFFQIPNQGFVQKSINAVSKVSGEQHVARACQGTDCSVGTIYDLSGGNFYGAVLRDKEILGAAKSNTKYAFELNEERRQNQVGMYGWLHVLEKS